MTVRRLWLIGFFFVSLYPMSIEGIGVNYIFALLPLLSVTVLGRAQYPGSTLMLLMNIFVAIFFAATAYQYDLIDESGRRLISFALFMCIFSYAFVKVDDEMVVAFKTAVVISSVYFSLMSVVTLLSAGAITVGYKAKDLVGTQRIGFVYLLALWLVYIDKDIRRSFGVLRYGAILVIIVGLLLTFSRASIVAAAGSFGLFGLTRIGQWFRTMSPTRALKAISTVLGLGILLGIAFYVFPLAFLFFGENLFNFLANADEVQAHLTDPNSSEGTRLLLVQEITEFISRNPVTGSGYLGVWVLPGAPTGSAHNQYLDVLFRTGLLGLLAYVFLLIALLRRLVREEQALFWGVVGILIYGLFHETFKESHGAGVLAFLVGMLAQSYRDQRQEARDPAAVRADRRFRPVSSAADRPPTA